MKKDVFVWYKHIMYDGAKRIGFRDFKTLGEAVADVEHQKTIYSDLISTFEIVTTVHSLGLEICTPITCDGKIIAA